jgi:hypothetical protein
MWNTDTIWFDVSLITCIFSFGHIFFGHFEVHTPKWRKVLKLALFICLSVAITSQFGRAWTLGFLGVMTMAVVIIHAIILPAKGINGWTAEPKEKYYKMRGWEKYLKQD